MQTQMEAQIKTPCFIFHLEQLNKNLSLHKTIAKDLNIKLIYSIKSLSHVAILKAIAKHVKGFSVSSVFEAKLAHHISNNQHTTHFVSPGVRIHQWKELLKNTHFVTFNSLEQFLRFQAKKTTKISYGLRVNPELSFVKDHRYNPCRKFSKLGVPLPDMLEFLKNNPYAKNAQGLHFHNNCDSQDFFQLEKTFKKIESMLKNHLHQFKWINLGGGYVFNPSNKKNIFYKLIQYIKKTYNFEHIIIEPGYSIIQNTVQLVSSVIDIFKRGGKTIAVLDTTVNHLPEVFEYQYQPDILEHDAKGRFEYILAGCSCLAGDTFRSYRFTNKLDIGSLVTFNNVGAYSLVKANMFNGINLPNIYCQKDKSMLKKIKTYTFKDYINYWGGSTL